MILDAWKKKSIKRKLDVLLKSVEKPKKVSHIALIGILVDVDNFKDEDAFQSMRNALGKGVNYALIGYSKKAKEVTGFSEYVYDYKAFDHKAKIKDANLDEFLRKPFDLLISYYNIEDIFLQFVTAKSTASFKIGFPQSQMRLNDLTIDVKINESKTFCNEMIKYLKILKLI